MQVISPETLKLAKEYLTTHDQRLSGVIKEVGDCTIKVEMDYFRSLVTSIVSQQLSAKAADTIFDRLQTLCDQNIHPETIKKISKESIRSVGISESKSRFILELASRFDPVEFSSLREKENDDALKYLTSFKGIGEWTAHIFLIFSLGRLDVFPIRDVGLQNGMKNIYNNQDLKETEMIEITNKWSPYRSVGSWYVWKSLEQFQ